MAIVKMKKLRLLAMSADREALLRELLLLGCVEVSEPTELSEEAYPALSRCDSAELAMVKAQHAELTNAVKLLDKYAPEKSGFLKPLPEAEASELLDEAKLPQDIALAEKIMELEEHIRRNGAEVQREQSQLESLAPWLPLDLPLSCKGHGARRRDDGVAARGGQHDGRGRRPRRGRTRGAALPCIRRQEPALRAARLSEGGAGRGDGGPAAHGSEPHEPGRI